MRTRDRTEQESGKMCETWTNEEIFIATSWKQGEDGYSSQEVTRIPGSLCKKSGYIGFRMLFRSPVSRSVLV